jgi:hypothetical protein
MLHNSVSKHFGTNLNFRVSYALFERRKKYVKYMRIYRIFMSAKRKSAKSHIYGRSANLTNSLSPKICGFAKLTCGPLTFVDITKVRVQAV